MNHLPNRATRRCLIDIVTTWAEKIAQELAPQEIDQVPFIVKDFVQGGKARRDLLKPQRSGGALGGFGLGDFSNLLAWALQGIVVTAPLLCSVLSSEAVPNTIALLKELKAVTHTRHTKTPTSSPTINKGVEQLTANIAASGMSQGQREEAACKVMIVLLENPSQAVAFIQKLTEK